jgi:hypothetical protein
MDRPMIVHEPGKYRFRVCTVASFLLLAVAGCASPDPQAQWDMAPAKPTPSLWNFIQDTMRAEPPIGGYGNHDPCP